MHGSQMRGSQLRSLMLSILGLATLAGCAHTAPQIVPQTTLAAVIEVAPRAEATEAAEPAEEAAPVVERVTHPVDITVDHLPPPASFEPHATTYVFWVRASDDDAWTNATHLDPSKTQETTTFAYPQDVLFVHVTAEASVDARLPSDKVVLSTRVSRNGACASGVDQSDVTMKVRMCR
jgi:hypothetical protein